MVHTTRLIFIKSFETVPLIVCSSFDKAYRKAYTAYIQPYVTMCHIPNKICVNF